MQGRGGQAIRRKIDALRAADPEPGTETAARVFRRALARAARDAAGLAVEVMKLGDYRRSLVELLDLPPERALLALVEGPRDALGLIALSPDLMAAMIEMQTVGRLAAQSPPPRRPTRTDAAICAGLIEGTLLALEEGLQDATDLVWAGGFRSGSFLEDPRPLALLLEDQAYRVLAADIAIGDDGRVGTALLALPAEGRGRRVVPMAAQPVALAQARDWSMRLAAAVSLADVRLEVVLARPRLPLSKVMTLEAGMVLPLGAAALDAVAMMAPGGLCVATGRLGQNRGARALRLTSVKDEGAAGPPAPNATVATVAEPAAAAQDPAKLPQTIARSA